MREKAEIQLKGKKILDTINEISDNNQGSSRDRPRERHSVLWPWVRVLPSQESQPPLQLPVNKKGSAPRILQEQLRKFPDTCWTLCAGLQYTQTKGE